MSNPIFANLADYLTLHYITLQIAVAHIGIFRTLKHIFVLTEVSHWTLSKPAECNPTSYRSLKVIFYIIPIIERIILEKLIVSQLVKKFTKFCRARTFITAFPTARHVTLSWYI